MQALKEKKNKMINSESPSIKPVSLAQKNAKLLEPYIRNSVAKLASEDEKWGFKNNYLIELVVKFFPFDILELKEYIKTTLKKNPTITNQNLSILLLQKVANNHKYKKMAKIAQEMLEERWWEKSG